MFARQCEAMSWDLDKMPNQMAAPLKPFYAVLAAPLALLRMLAAMACVAMGLITQIVFFAWIKPKLARSIVSLWSKAMLLCLGVRIQKIGVPTLKPALFVCNHVSWLDILVLQASAPVVFVAKSEIQSWPVIGRMVTMAGTCYIHREKRTALRGVHSALTLQLRKGQSICIFPEGATSNGLQVLPFHGGLLQAAIDAAVPVQTMRLIYSHDSAAYIDDITLISSALSITRTLRLTVQVHALTQITAHLASGDAGPDAVRLNRQQLALVSRAAIVNSVKR